MVDMKFVLAGKAVFTVSNNKDEHFTYKIEKHKEQNMYFANVLSSGNDTYSYMGFLDNERKNVVQGKKGMSQDAKSVKVLQWALKVIRGEATLPTGYDIQHIGRCSACFKPLTDPESIRTGLGPVCRGKIK